ncbi:hypothetical protein L228DRAFT_171200 [Xylona heveae TC161]|uniref:Rap-GAP domain-containing protein n=1 Tax=Xylona heveae (strain CBS 132557 / TC161) TaxID=1328760 RepID=A0A165FTQ8_XYLHT|nr:hypothetical protein L228DRAFT_171200 [Xylona heveae TC161]KZF21365.1 hypothetical protein L228DRAFT_171200 [Xylona heveae TC161]
MPPPSDASPSAPETRTAASGLAGVFRNLTAGRLKSSMDPLPTLTTLEPAHSSTLESQSKEPNRALPDEGVLGGPPELAQLLKQLQPASSMNARVSAAEEIGRILELYPLKNVAAIWSAGRSLVDKHNVASTRKEGFGLLIACVKHAKLTPLERRHFFDEITMITNPEDFIFQLAALEELAKRGKDVESFEGLMVPVLTRWLQQCFQLATLARAALRKEKSAKAPATLAEEATLTQVFNFLRDIIKFNFRSFRELDIQDLLEQVLAICRKTTAEVDVDNAIKLIDTMITYAYIPDAMLESCIEVLCNIYGSIKGLIDPAWNAISNLLRSHVAQKTSDFLLAMISEAASHRGRNMNAICGAISIMRRVETANPADRLPNVPLRKFVRALELALPARSARLSSDILKALTHILENDDLMESTSEKTWDSLLEVVVQCSKNLEEVSGNRKTSHQQGSLAPKENKDHGSIGDLPPLLSPIFSRLESLYENLDPFQRASVMWFFMELADRLPDSCAELLVNYYKQENLCYPSNERWLVDSRRLVEVYLKQGDRPSALRIELIQTLTDAYQTISYICPHDVVSEFAMSVLDCIEVERDVRILDPLVTFAVEVASDADENLFSKIITLLRERAIEPSRSLSAASGAARSTSPSPLRSSTSPAASQFQAGTSTFRVAAEGLVKIFIGSLKSPSFKGLMTYTELLHIARSETAEIDAKIAVLKLLFRLRADSNYAIYIIPFTESENLAASLWRTLETTSESNESDETGTIRSSRSDEARNEQRISRIDRSISVNRPNSHPSKPANRPLSGMPRATKAIPPLWMHSGHGFLPIDPPEESSPMLFSTDEIPDMATERPIGCATISMNLWLEAVIPILQQGADWEIYSYVLLHLGSQLTNHALFLGSRPQIRMLRNILCEQIRATSFYDPPQTTGLRRSDVATCLFQVLSMLVSFRKHFAKSEEDEIVRTFVLGVGSWDTTSPGCIHALSVCCYELPLSVTKSLNQILQKMSQIITQSHVTVHILEFLVGLARLPEVYVNFRDDEFRTVIGIGFRYLQYVREQREKGQSAPSLRGHPGLNKHLSPTKDAAAAAAGSPDSTSSASKGAQDLPQYVYALAYHVITFWFMALKLQDRPKFVPWMTKSLVYTDSSGREVVEEQSRVTIDMMQRVAYSDRDETLPNTEFAKAHDGNILTKSYLVGLCIITIETATASGLSQITKRQPSGTDYFMFRPQAAKPPQHQVPLWNETVSEPGNPASRKAVLPSYISLILNSAAAVTPRSLQPIPLPDDDATKRAINMFDRNATVDGYKVGIIYIGEGQTHEVDILSNEVGSPDYTDFITKIGTLVRLKGATFNTQGLDREFDIDGEYAICWRDRVSEIVFHTTTMMPTNLDHDPQCINKKRHTGNDFVNIVFNNSGLPFNFDTFPSEFNYVNIVITPESRAAFVSRLSPYHGGFGKYYKVQVMSKPGFPRISTASEIKMVSGQSLPAFVRMLALNSSTLSLVWANRAGGEHISPWRNRLRQINQLRERNAGGTTGGASSPTSTSPVHQHAQHLHSSSSHHPHGPHGQAPGGLGQAGSTFSSSLSGAAGPRRTSIAAFLSEATASHRSSVSSSGLSSTTERDENGANAVETLAESFDFSRWA